MSKQSPLKKANTRSLTIYSLLSLIIICLPFLMYFTQYIPEGQIWHTLLFDVETFGFRTVKHFFYMFLDRVIPLLLFCFTFFLIRKGWNHAFVPIIFLYLHRLFNVTNVDTQFVDGYEYVHSMPLALIVIILLYVFRFRFKQMIDVAGMKERLDLEIEGLKTYTENNKI